MNQDIGLSYTPKAFVGKKAPNFTANFLLNGEINKNTDFLNWKGNKYAVLYFYPLDFTFVCPTEICNFSDAGPSFSELGKMLFKI
jgi:alkyl hydroperoxide reductase subunit AhpC